MYYELHTTCKDKTQARKIGEALVKQKLAACINIISNIESIYWWEGKINTDQEILLIAKTSLKKINLAMELIRKMHSYKLPIIFCQKIDILNKGVSSWINKVLN